MHKRHFYLVIALLMVSTLLAFGRIGSNDFINFDDPGYITENPIVQSGLTVDSIRKAFTTVVVANWVPLAILSHTLDGSLFGNTPAGHHLMSLLFHLGAVLFLFLFLYKTTNRLWASAFAAAFFALHPLRVESVAWASERKDVLSLFFGMASLYAYAFYAKDSRLYQYFICLVLFVLSLLSKSMLVTLPFVFLLVDYWPLGRWTQTAGIGNHTVFRRLLVEKIPFFLLTGGFSVVTFMVQHDKGVVYPPLGERIAGSLVAYVMYLKKTFWPFDLALFYFSVESFPLWQVIGSGVILLIITGVVLYTLRKRPFLFTGWFWFLGTLVPVIGLVPTSAWVADHYLYLPAIGLSILLAWGIPAGLDRAGLRHLSRKVLWPAGIAVLILLALLTFRQCGFWNNSLALWNYTVKVTKDNALAHNLLANTLAEKGNNREAFFHYNEAIRISPDYADAYYNRGTAYDKSGFYQDAIHDYNKVIALKRGHANVFYNRGTLYGKIGQYQQAVEDLNQAIRLRPDYPETYNNRGNSFLGLGDYKRAIEDYSKAIVLNGNYVDAYKNRASVYFMQNNIQEGCRDARQACALGHCKKWDAARAKGYCR